MPRNGSGVYSKPAGTTAVASTVIESAKYNSTVDDLVADANAARPVVAGGTGATSASGARTALGVAIGTDVQAYDAGLASIAGLTTAADKMVYTTALDAYAVADLTPLARTFSAQSTAAGQRTVMELGTAAEVNTGVLSGDVPLIGAGDVLPVAVLPTGTGVGELAVVQGNGFLDPSILPSTTPAAEAVGAYAILGRSTQGAATFTLGSSYAGSGLRHASFGILGDSWNTASGVTVLGYSRTTAPPGTWRAMGAPGGGNAPACLFLRIL